MARLATWIVLAVAAGAVSGCGPAKELPDEVPNTPQQIEKPAAAVPAASEPAARALADRAIQAFTGGKPELVAKGKVCRRTLRGTRVLGTDPNPIETVQTEAAVWPDRYRSTVNMQRFGTPQVLTTWLHRPHLVVMNGELEQPLPNVPETERNLTNDITAQLWLPLLVPLTDPKTVVFDYRKSAIGQQEIETLKLSLGDLPIYQLTFDAKSSALLRVEYTTKASGVDEHKVGLFAEHKKGTDGLLLPIRAEFQINKVTVEIWVAEKWEFPATIEDKEFAPPKK